MNRTDRSPGAGGTAVAESAPGQSTAGGPPGADDVRRIPLAPCLAAGLAVLLAAMVLGASVGPLYVPFAEVVQIVAGKLGLASAAGPDQRDVSVVWQLRVPRVLLGAMVGAALAMSGAALQSLFNNPLADPGIIGVSGGASTGAVAVIVLAGGTASAWPVPLGAFAAGLGVSALIYALARPGRTRGTARLLLVGIAVGSGCQALTGFFTYIADDAQLQTLTFWQMGSLGKADWEQVAAVVPVFAVAAVILARSARTLDVLTLGERQAQHLGLNVKRSRAVIVVATALLTGAAVAFAGTIGFVGLVVPHIVRILTGPGHRALLPLSAITGSVLLIAADTASRTLNPPSEIPIGLFTAAAGAPFFLFLIVRMKRSSW
ncbi:FecCD family ABC transporter permease [Nocardiopsis composta]|uniref:Iron complex transport system permease protein n=1 Tax=Nocardiopsis composta TaxID=157465 RepID=A0A7W8VBZ7_9ACTN|nr:iron ABC transporter permease [Nocardiopsis composta]MBB5430916.1 iron complex transport system permease protein [Nocardiopsis composta]